MENNEAQARDVILALRSFAARFDEIMNLIGDKPFLSLAEKDKARGLLRALKGDLKQAAKYGTVSGTRTPRNDFEQRYLAPAVFQASANLSAKINADPIRGNWFSSLYAARMDITFPLRQLEGLYPDI